jgi:hypothetical protein
MSKAVRALILDNEIEETRKRIECFQKTLLKDQISQNHETQKLLQQLQLSEKKRTNMTRIKERLVKKIASLKNEIIQKEKLEEDEELKRINEIKKLKVEKINLLKENFQIQKKIINFKDQLGKILHQNSEENSSIRCELKHKNFQLQKENKELNSKVSELENVLSNLSEDELLIPLEFHNQSEAEFIQLLKENETLQNSYINLEKKTQQLIESQKQSKEKNDLAILTKLRLRLNELEKQNIFLKSIEKSKEKNAPLTELEHHKSFPNQLEDLTKENLIQKEKIEKWKGKNYELQQQNLSIALNVSSLTANNFELESKIKDLKVKISNHGKDQFNFDSFFDHISDNFDF